MKALGTPAPKDQTFRFSVISGVSSDGSVVAIHGGGAAAADTTAYICNGNGWFVLRDILTGAGVDMTAWKLDQVCGCSADGTLVYGSGKHNGGDEGFVAEFPAGFLATCGDPGDPPEQQSESQQNQAPALRHRFVWR